MEPAKTPQMGLLFNLRGPARELSCANGSRKPRYGLKSPNFFTSNEFIQFFERQLTEQLRMSHHLPDFAMLSCHSRRYEVRGLWYVDRELRDSAGTHETPNDFAPANCFGQTVPDDSGGTAPDFHGIPY